MGGGHEVYVGKSLLLEMSRRCMGLTPGVGFIFGVGVGLRERGW